MVGRAATVTSIQKNHLSFESLEFFRKWHPREDTHRLLIFAGHLSLVFIRRGEYAERTETTFSEELWSLPPPTSTCLGEGSSPGGRVQGSHPHCGPSSAASGETWVLPGTWGKAGQKGTPRKKSSTTHYLEKSILYFHCLRRRDIISRLLKGFYSMKKWNIKRVEGSDTNFNTKSAEGSASMAETGCRKGYQQWGDSL